MGKNMGKKLFYEYFSIIFNRLGDKKFPPAPPLLNLRYL